MRIQQFEDGAAKKTKTDGQGAYRVTLDAPGAYFAAVSKDGYSGMGQLVQPLTIEAARPQAVVNISLMRVGEVNGRVLDESTREPVAGVGVSLFIKQWRYGQLSPSSLARDPAITDGDGRFRVTELRPGEYIASARPAAFATVRVVKDFSKTDVDKIDEAYPATYWPGGSEAALAFGATLTSGGYADIGNIFVRKVPQYRIRAAVQGNCAEGDLINLSLLQRNGGSATSLGTFACSSELLLRGFDPGSYVLYASSERRNGDLATSVSGVAPIEVVDKNLSVTIPLQRDVLIDGQVTIVDGANTSRVVTRISARPFDLMPGARLEGETAIRWAPDQRHFQLAVSPRTQNLIVSDPIGSYVKEIRYNGTPLRSSTLPINPGATAHKLEIVMDDKWGSLAATVTDGSRGVPAAVLIVKDTTRVQDLGALPTIFRTIGQDGAMPATQLAPGDYRLIAVAAAQSQRIHEGGMLERLLSAAQRVTVSPGGAQTVTIRVSEAREPRICL